MIRKLLEEEPGDVMVSQRTVGGDDDGGGDDGVYEVVVPSFCGFLKG